MDVILKQLGYPDGTVKDRYEKFNATLQLPPEPDPRPMLVARVDGIVQDAARRSAVVFDLRPTAPVTVKREPTFSEKGAAAHYTPPAPDGTLPGIYWIPLADLGPKVTWLGAGLRSTAYHEAIPGHHFQVAIQLESNELPRFRKFGVFGFNSAFGEGWGLYAERLADENGWYDGDLTGQLGYLQLQLFRARRLVADTGLHAKHWTRQQVIDYGFTEAEDRSLHRQPRSSVFLHDRPTQNSRTARNGQTGARHEILDQRISQRGAAWRLSATRRAGAGDRCMGSGESLSCDARADVTRGLVRIMDIVSIGFERIRADDAVEVPNSMEVLSYR